MDRIVKLLIAQIGFMLLGVILAAIPCILIMGIDIAKVHVIVSGLFLGSLLLIWYMLSKKYVRLDSLTWSFHSVKAIILIIILNVLFFFFANGLDGLTDFLGYEDLNENFSILRDLALNPFGLCVLLFVSPVAEEFLYQGAILSSLLWGYLYYRSGSLRLCILSNMIVNGISALLIIYYPNVRSVYEIIGTVPFAGLAVLSVILSAICIYYLNRSLKIPAWQISESRDGETGSVVINE